METWTIDDRRRVQLLCAVAAAALLAGTSNAAAPSDWLSLGSKHWAPTITSKPGIGTAHAVTEARVTRKEIAGWCAN